VTRRLRSASLFTDDGRLKTLFQKCVDDAGRYDRQTGLPKTAFERVLQRASRVDRSTGMAKDRT
jgi:hypothetical protein